MKYRNLLGLKFDKLLVTKEVGRRRGYVLWECVCDCGAITQRPARDLKEGKKTFCDICVKSMRTKHGNSKKNKRSSLYTIWANMKTRCLNKQNRHYKNYGGRGIKIFEEWLVFQNFFDWSILNGYQEGYSIDRINPYDGYNPKNCQWISFSDNGKKQWSDRFSKEKFLLEKFKEFLTTVEHDDKEALILEIDSFIKYYGPREASIGV